MRILRLDLLVFGPFTGESLALDKGEYGLHVVYGPNEAGKSSSLRALREWFYGIRHNSGDNFIHSHQNLRIGGLLESADGARLEFIRRKGRSKTVRGPDDAEVIEPSRVIDMLGGLNEVAFAQRFGIDYEELRKGGEAVVRGAGDLGEILFAAGAGMADLGLVQKRLDEEANQLFKPRGSVQGINQAISELATTRRTIKDTQLLTSEWLKHDKALREASQRQFNLDTQLHDKRSERNRLDRFEKALPLLGRLSRVEADLATVADAPLLPDDFSANRGKAITEVANARRAESEASEAIEKHQAAIAGMSVPTALLEHRTAVGRLHTELGSYQKAAKDRPGLVSRLETSEELARTILQDLGSDPELEQAEQLRLSRTQRQRIQALAGDCKVRLDKHTSADDAVRNLGGKLKLTESQLAALPTSKDASDLRRAIRRAQKHGDLDQQIADADTTLRELEEQSNFDLNKLRLWTGTLEQLEKMAVPAMETIERFENEITDAASAVQKTEERIDNLKEQGQKLDQTFEKLQLEHDVPTEEDLERARQQRDEGWQLVRRSWRDGQPADNPSFREFIDRYAHGEDLEKAFQCSVEAADAIADRLRREADRVAEKAQLTAERHELDRQLNEQQERLDSVQQHLDGMRSEWRDQWMPLKIDPLSPREMRPWLNQQTALVNAAAAIRKQRSTVEAAESLRQSLRVDLNDWLKLLGQSIPNQADDLSQALEYCESAADAIDSATRDRQQCESNLRHLRDELLDCEHKAKQAKDDLELWQSDWSDAVSALGLDRDAAPAEVNSMIESVDEVFSLYREAEELRDRIEGIDRDAEEFRGSVQSLLEQVAEDLLNLPVDQAVADLHDRLESAGTAQTKVDAWTEQLEAEESRRDQAQSKVEELVVTIKSMCQEARCASPAELPAAEDRSTRRRDVEQELRAIDEQLDGLAAGGPLTEFINEASQFDPDQLSADSQQLDEEIIKLDREKTEVAEAIGGHRNELRRMDGSDRAAEAQEQVEHLLAAIGRDSEQYIRLQLAASVLRRSIERYREVSKGPVLGRASELFAELTLGSFDGLRADYDDKGNAALVGVRAGSGQVVTVEGMSDGTCDQLYLALRLALLDSYLSGRESLPFIVDDVLIMFDDDRAVAALKCLARLSEKTQVIFFTHHEHLVQLARDNLDDDVLFTHMLDHRSAVIPQAIASKT